MAPDETGAARASLREVARVAGVALSSASRVLSGHPDVSESMRRRVLAAAEELGYEPNLLWHGLRRGATRTAGFVHRDISSPVTSVLALAAEGILQAHGYSMLLSNTRGLPEVDVSEIRLLDQRRVDGLMVAPNDTQDPETLSVLERLRVPFVAIDRDLPARLAGGAVLVDHGAAVRAAAQRLLELGHRHFGFVSPPASLRPAVEVARALRAVITPSGGTLHVEAGPTTAEHGAAATSRLLELPEPVTALFAGGAQTFAAMLALARDRGLRIPDQLSLVTVDDHPLLALLDPPISVVSRQPAAVGAEAARLLLRMLAGGRQQVRTIPAVYTDRASCAPAPALTARAERAGA